MWKHRVAFFLGLLLLATLWYGSSHRTRQLNAAAGLVAAETAPITAEQMQDRIDQAAAAGVDLPPLVLWQRQEAQLVSGYLNRQTTLQAVTYLGAADRLYVPEFLQGTWPTESWGCVIDETVAHAIFGSDQVLGQSLQWGASTYHITGIVADGGGVGYFPTTDGDDTAMSHLLLDLTQTGTGVFGAELVLQQLNISAASCFDLGLWVWLLQAAERLPVFMLWVDLSIAAVSLHRRMGRLSLLTCASSAGCLTAAALLWKLGKFPSLPARLLPSRWSDFTFWTTQVQRMADSVKALFQNGGAQWELTFWADLFLGFAAATAATILLGHLLRVGRNLTGRTVAAVSILWWLMLLGLIYKNRATAYAMVDSTLLLALPVWLSLRWGLERYERWIFDTGKEETHEAMAESSIGEETRP